MSPLYSKVTVIVENDEMKVTHTIPIARNITLEMTAIEIREGVIPREYLTDSLGFNFGLIADRDPKVGHVMRTETITKGQPMEKTANQRVADGDI